MATLQVFSIRDSAMDMFQQPFCLPSRGGAIRAFGDAVKNKETPFYKHPEHYELFYLGQFHEELGSFDLLDKPQSVSLATDFAKGE